MKLKRKYFTLVEVLLALGVCAIGVCSIMVLFPVGSSASRDAAALTYVANFADELLHFKGYQIQLSNDKWQEIVVGKKIATTVNRKESGNLYKTENGALAEELRKESRAKTSWVQDELMEKIIPGMYVHKNHKEIYQIVARRGKNGDYWDDTDFRCIGVLWQENLPGFSSNDIATRLKLEMSWPAEVPYSQRQKSIFTLELFNKKR